MYSNWLIETYHMEEETSICLPQTHQIRKTDLLDNDDSMSRHKN